MVYVPVSRSVVFDMEKVAAALRQPQGFLLGAGACCRRHMVWGMVCTEVTEQHLSNNRKTRQIPMQISIIAMII